jgi:hypothetical protein
MMLYNEERQHQGLGYRTRACGYVDDRRCRPAPLPPLPEQARKAGKCSPSPTSHSATANTGFDIDEVKSGIVEPAIAVAAIGADLELGRATP